MALRAFADGALFAETIGSESPRVLALHGWGRRGADFGPSMEGLSALAPDFPGFGASPDPVEAIGAVEYADLVVGLLEEFKDPPVVVGHSFGGRVAVCLAAAHPDQVGPLVLTGAPLVRLKPPSRPKLSYRVMRSLNRFGVVSDERMEGVRARSGSPDYRALTGVMRDVFVKVVNETYDDELRAVKSKVRLVWGSDDDEVPVAVAEHALEILRGAGVDSTLEVLTGVDHLVPIHAPNELRKAVDEVMTP